MLLVVQGRVPVESLERKKSFEGLTDLGGRVELRLLRLGSSHFTIDSFFGLLDHIVASLLLLR